MPCPTNKTMRTRFLSGFLIPELLLPPSIIRMFGPKAAIFAPRYALLGTCRACRLIWCPVGWLVGGCISQGCISQDTDLLYLALLHIFKDFQCCFFAAEKSWRQEGSFLAMFPDLDNHWPSLGLLHTQKHSLTYFITVHNAPAVN